MPANHLFFHQAASGLVLRFDGAADSSPPGLPVGGGQDHESLTVDRAVLSRRLRQRRLEVGPGARRAFEMPGSPDTMSRLAGVRFETHLAMGRPQ